MNILIVANHYAVCSARYATDAFTRLGHTVRHVGPAKGREIWGLTLPPEYEWRPDDADHVDDGLWTGVHNQGWAEERPDLVVVMDSDPAILGSVEYLDNTIPVVVWGVDNHVRDYRRPYFDHYFLAHRSVSVMKWEGKQSAYVGTQTLALATWTGPHKDMTWLPCGSSVEFTPSPIVWEQRRYDVACLGFPYPQRLMLVDAMKKAGLKVAWGNGLVYENFAAAYHDSRVSLCVSANHDLAQRVFETGRLGCAVLSDPLPDLELFDPDHPIVEYHSVDEAVELARSMQGRPGLGEACARWAEPETWEKRAEAVVSWYNERK